MTKAAPFFSVCLIFSAAVYAQDANQDYQRSVAEISRKIESVAAQLNQQKGQLNSARNELLKTERQQQKVRKSIQEINNKRTELSNKIKTLNSDIRTNEERSKQSKAALRSLIKSRYKAGSETYLKLILNQQNPYAVGRLNNYNQYFSNAIQARIKEIRQQLEQTTKLQQQLIETQEVLSIQVKQQEAQENRLNKVMTQRTNLIKQLDQEVAAANTELVQLTQDRDRLNSLIQQIAERAAELARAEAKRRRQLEQQDAANRATPAKSYAPVPGGFARQKGRLNYPSGGRQLRKYGTRVASSGMTSEGVFFSTEASDPVTAIYRGRVLFADFLKGYGLLLIIDHGDEHISLYGHNEVLYKAVGDSVETGELISRSGVTGGLKSPGLYFEIRKNTSPINPAQWFQN